MPDPRLHEDHAFIQESALEVAFEEKQAVDEQRQLVADLLSERLAYARKGLARREQYLAFFDECIEAARGDDVVVAEKKIQPARLYTVSPDHFPWIGEEHPIRLNALASPNGNSFLWGDMSHLTKSARKHYPRYADAEPLIERVQTHVGLLLDEASSPSLRRDRDFRTDLTVYKDGNLQGDNYRALLFRDRVEKEQVFLLGALYQHADQAAVLEPMMTRSYRKD